MSQTEIPPQVEVLKEPTPCDAMTGENPEIRMSAHEKELPEEVEAEIREIEITAEPAIETNVETSAPMDVEVPMDIEETVMEAPQEIPEVEMQENMPTEVP